MMPQIIFLALVCADCGCALELHGEPKRGRWNFYTHSLTWLAIAALLWWGGFFDCFLGATP